jgi:hypothetical protein
MVVIIKRHNIKASFYFASLYHKPTAINLLREKPFKSHFLYKYLEVSRIFGKFVDTLID